MSFEGVPSFVPESEDVTLPSPFKRVLNHTSDLYTDDSKSKYYEQIKRINVLEYELSNSQNQLLLDKLDHDKVVVRYEKELKLKNDEISVLTSNENFLYDQNQELVKELDELKRQTARESKLNRDEILKLRQSESMLKDELAELSAGSQREIYQLQTQVVEYKTRLSNLEEHLRQQGKELENQISINTTQLQKIKELEDQVEVNPLHSVDGDTELLLYKGQSHSQIEYIEQLTFKLSQSEKKLLQLQKDNELVQVLKEERNYHLKKLQMYKDNEMELQNLRKLNQKLQIELQRWNNISATPLQFQNEFKLIRDENKILQNSIKELSKSKSDLIIENQSLFEKLHTANMVIENGNNKLHKLSSVIAHDINFKKLMEQELSFVKQQLEFSQSENKMLLSGRHKRPASEHVETPSDTQLIELQKLVDNYKSEWESAITDLNKFNEPASVKTEYPHIDTTQIAQLQRQLQSKESEISILKENIKSLTEEINILNTSQPIKPTPTQETDVPKSVYDRLLSEQSSLQDKLYESNKRLTRLKESFETQIVRFKSIIFELFGYSIEFLTPNELRIKLGDEFIMVNIDDELNVTIPEQQTGFNKDLAPLLNQFTIDQKDIPKFFASLTLEIK